MRKRGYLAVGSFLLSGLVGCASDGLPPKYVTNRDHKMYSLTNDAREEIGGFIRGSFTTALEEMRDYLLERADIDGDGVITVEEADAMTDMLRPKVKAMVEIILDCGESGRDGEAELVGK